MVLKISLRNVFRQRRRSFFTAMSMFAGFVLGAFFISWSDGMYGTMIDGFTRSRMGHIQIHKKGYTDKPTLYKNFEMSEKLSKAIEESDDVESFSYRVSASAIVSFGDKTAGVKFTGFNRDREEATTGFSKKLIEGRMFRAAEEYECVIGKGLAEYLKVKPGDKLVALTQGGDGSMANDMFIVTGIVEVGNEVENRIAFYTALKSAGEFLVLEGKAHEMAIVINDIDDVYDVREDIVKRAGDDSLHIETWQEFARDFYVAMEADRNGMYMMLVIIVAVVAMGVLNTVLMTVLERKKEYGVLKAVGTRPSFIVKMVVTECNIIALISVLAGSLISAVLIGWLETNGITLSEGFSYGGMEIRKMHTALNLRSFIIPAFTIFFTATLVSVIPALKASKTDPVKSMRAG